MKLTTSSSRETQEFGENFAKKLRGGEILALVGDLGSGKTTFVQGLARGLGIKSRVISPTFILMRQYEKPSLKRSLLSKLKFFYHIDLYRLEGDFTDEVKNLGLDDVWGKKDTIVAVEWAEKIKDLFPKNTIWIKFDTKSENQRLIDINRQFM